MSDTPTLKEALATPLQWLEVEYPTLSPVVAAARAYEAGTTEWVCQYPEFNDDACRMFHPDPEPDKARQPRKHTGCGWMRLSPVAECDHEWVDARNEIVLSGEVCLKCGAIRAGNVVET